jgi:molybdopterin-guanine dinucleotide biosynthesis protein A
MATTDARHATLAVLAGGEGRRMGRAKALLRVGDRAILQYLHGRFAWRGPACVVTAPGRENPPGAGVFDRELVDPQAGIGPLRGVLTALENLKTPLLVIATVDMPLIEREHLEFLLEALVNRPGAMAVMYRRMRDGALAPEPFPLVVRREAVELVRARLCDGKGSVVGLLDNAACQTVEAPAGWPERMWANLNRPEDPSGLTGFGIS